MKFNKSGDHQWESEDWRWCVTKVEDKVFALYDSSEYFTFVGDFPSLDLAALYADYVFECEVQNKLPHLPQTLTEGKA